MGWDYDLKNEKKPIESVPDSLIASYTVNFSSTAINSSSVLVFSIAESKESSNPKSEGKWVKSEKGKDEESKGKKEEDKSEPKKPINFILQLSDASGQAVSFLLSHFLLYKE